MSEIPGINPTQFKITLNEEWTHFTPLPFYYKHVSDVKEVYKPKNLISRIRKFFGFKYESKLVGYEYDIESAS